MPESPTTVRPLDMDDDEGQESGIINEPQTQGVTGVTAKDSKDESGSGDIGGDGGNLSEAPTGAGAPASTNPDAQEAPPPKPPRPMTEAQKNEMMLKEAFPSVDVGVIKAVLRASGGQVEPAFHALLG